jgi:predicted phage-related endonuclease
MNPIDLIQGSPEWHAHRANHFNASDAPAMMGESPHMTRTELLQRMKTGVSPEVDPATQRRFDNGHRFEALARPLAEAIVCEELYPVTGTHGKLSASFDGLTLLESIAFEHKTLNARLRAAFERIADAVARRTLVDDVHPTLCAAQLLPVDYLIQLEHQCHVAGCEKVLFMASSWDAEGSLIEEQHCWYTPNPSLRAALLAGWAQFESDMATFVPAVIELKPTGRAPESLPALRIEVSGAVTASNLAEFKTTALAAIRGVNLTLSTDQDFADAERSVKWCEEVESRLKAAKEHALSQTASIDALFRTIDDISTEARRVRLDLDRLVKARKEELRRAIVTRAMESLQATLSQLEQIIGHGVRISVSSDFAGVVKGKRSLASMQDAVDTELARTKIEANDIATRLQANIQSLRGATHDWTFLFPDLAHVAAQPTESFTALTAHRVNQFDQEQESARIRAIHLQQAALQQREVDAATHTEPPEASKVIQIRATEFNPGARISLGKLNAILYPLSITGEALVKLGFEPVERAQASKLYRATDVPAIGLAISAHVLGVTAQAQARAA